MKSTPALFPSPPRSRCNTDSLPRPSGRGVMTRGHDPSPPLPGPAGAERGRQQGQARVFLREEVVKRSNPPHDSGVPHLNPRGSLLFEAIFSPTLLLPGDWWEQQTLADTRTAELPNIIQTLPRPPLPRGNERQLEYDSPHSLLLLLLLLGLSRCTGRVYLNNQSQELHGQWDTEHQRGRDWGNNGRESQQHQHSHN